jgi:hypothetical protein
MIVMGVITAIPFGLAIRQTMKAPKSHADLEDEIDPSAKYEREMEQEHAEMAARRAVMEAEEAQRKAEKRAHRKDLVGVPAASLGKAFDGIALGGPVADDVQDNLYNLRRYDISASVEEGLGNALGVVAKLGGYRDECEGFDQELEAAWGQPVPGSNDRPAWSSNGQRAVFDAKECTLTFERFVDVKKWIGHGDVVVPVDMVGKPAKALIAKLGPKADADESTIIWKAPSTGATSAGLTQLTAEVENGKITALNVHVAMDILTKGTVVDQITAVFGKGQEAAGYGDNLGVSWPNGKTPIEMTSTTTMVDIRIGK